MSCSSVFGALASLPSLAGLEHGRTIPLTDLKGQRRKERGVWCRQQTAAGWYSHGKFRLREVRASLLPAGMAKMAVCEREALTKIATKTS
jgi:hypothetical protein